MKIILIYKLSFILLSSVFLSNLIAQKQLNKFEETFKVNKEVSLQINSNHSKIIIKPWDKDQVSVRAYFEGDIKKEDRKELLANWQVSASNRENVVVIQTATGKFWAGDQVVAQQNPEKIHPADITALHAAMSTILQPILVHAKERDVSEQLSNKLKSINFDTALYQKNEKKYVEQWQRQIREKFGDNTDDLLKFWLQSLYDESNRIKLSSEIGFSNRAIAVANLQIPAANSVSKKLNVTQYIGDTVTVYQYRNQKIDVKQVKRILEINLPRTSKLQLDARHGNVKLHETVAAIKASLSYTSFAADEISGKESIIEISFAPIFVKKWSSGHLILNYVKNCRLQQVSNLRINSDSSNIFMQELIKNTAISGSFGTITISSLSSNFETLDLLVQNTDFKLNIPKSTVFNFSLSGSQNKIHIPETVKVSARKNFENVFVSGYQISRNTENLINIQAKYSNISLQSTF